MVVLRCVVGVCLFVCLFVFTKVVIEMGFGAFWKLTLFNEEPW
jgi:hypothetical protein